MPVLESPTYLNNDLLARNILYKNRINSNKDFTYFTKLCALNSAVIKYEDAVELSELSGDAQTFASYIRRFEDKKILILRHEITSAGFIPSYIRLCNENSFEFVFEYINETITMGLKDTGHHLPTFNELMYRGIAIPSIGIANFNTEFLDAKLRGNLETEPTIYSIPIHKDLFYCTNENIHLVYTYIIDRMRLQFNSMPLVHETLKIFNENLSTFQEKISSTSSNAWVELIDVLHKHLPHMKTNRRMQEYQDFLNFILILKLIVRSHAVYEVDTKTRETHLDEIQREIEQEILRYGNGISKENFDGLLHTLAQKYSLANDIELVQERISKNLLIPVEKVKESKIEGIIAFDNYLIHTSLLAACIASKYFSLCKQLKEYYSKLIKDYLMHKLPTKNIVFFNIHELELSVRQQVSKMDDFMYTILKNPVVLAHVIINSNQPNNNSSDTTDDADAQKGTLNRDKIEVQRIERRFSSMSVSKKLSSFFNLRTKQLLNWYEIFNIDVVGLTKNTFANLNFISKLILFFSNRYKFTLQKVKRISTIMDNERMHSYQTEESPQTFKFLQNK